MPRYVPHTEGGRRRRLERARRKVGIAIMFMKIDCKCRTYQRQLRKSFDDYYWALEHCRPLDTLETKT